MLNWNNPPEGRLRGTESGTAEVKQPDATFLGISKYIYEYQSDIHVLIIGRMQNQLVTLHPSHLKPCWPIRRLPKHYCL